MTAHAVERPSRPRILIVGGGYVGMYTALRLQKHLRRSDAAITVVDPQPYMTYQPFLPEAGAGNLQPPPGVVPPRPVLRGGDAVTRRTPPIHHPPRPGGFPPLGGRGRA